jgi:hypothetical protein
MQAFRLNCVPHIVTFLYDDCISYLLYDCLKQIPVNTEASWLIPLFLYFLHKSLFYIPTYPCKLTCVNELLHNFLQFILQNLMCSILRAIPVLRNLSTKGFSTIQGSLQGLCTE